LPTLSQRDLNPAVVSWSQQQVLYCSSFFACRANALCTYFSYLCTCDLYGPVHNVFDACRSITRASGRGLGPGNRDFGPCKMASSPKKSSQPVCSHLFHSFLPWRPLLLMKRCLRSSKKIVGSSTGGCGPSFGIIKARKFVPCMMS
jgi:hypothetical protein